MVELLRRRAIWFPVVLTAAVVVGCGGLDFGGPPVTTTTPTDAQIARCREVMYINPALEIEPLGFHLRPSLDDEIRFKFIAKTDDPSQLFDPAQVDAAKFAPKRDLYGLECPAPEKWWDVSARPLSGGNFSVPPPKAQGTWGLNVGYFKNDDGTLTVYVCWSEA